MAEMTSKPQGNQPPPSNRGHPMPRRTTPEQSVTLQHHRLTRDATRRANPGAIRLQVASIASPRRNSSGESHETTQSDPKGWFDRSNRNPKARFDEASMDVDPPFFQKETDSSAEEQKDVDVALRHPGFSFLPGIRPGPSLRPAVTHSSSADDYRSVIDDLTVENKRLKEELKRYRQFGQGTLRKDKLFEIKVHGLPKRKKRELEATLRDFAASLEGSSEATSQRRKPGKHMKNLYSSGGSLSKHASSSSSHYRTVDSAYASMSGGPSSHAATSSAVSLSRPSLGRAKSSGEQTGDNRIQDTPDGLFPRHMLMSDREKKKLVVKKLEQLFTGKISGRNVHRNHTLSMMDARSVPDASIVAPPQTGEASREAQIQPREMSQKKPRSRDMSTSNSNGDQTDSGGNGVGSGEGIGSGNGGHGNNNSPPTDTLPEQRPTRPRDLDPDRVQVPSENMDYIRHLGLEAPELAAGRRLMDQDVCPDEDGWVYLNLLCNLAQLHMISVTPSFIRSAVHEMSAKFQLSPDGRKIRWRGGSDGTKFSSDSSTENSQKSPSTDDTDGSNDLDQRKKQKTVAGDVVLPVLAGKESKFGPQITGAWDNFHYKPLFVHQSSSMETSMEETGSQVSSGAELEESAVDNGNSKWDYSGSGSSRKKRRHDGAIVYYSGAPFCTDLSGDPGDISPTTYMTAQGQLATIQSVAQPEFRRTLSGSSLPVRPCSDDRVTVAEALDMDLDQTPEIVWGTDDSVNDGFDFPWCPEPEKLQRQPFNPVLEASGLGGVLPEDHFAVVVTTRRTIFGLKNGPRHQFQSKSAEAADIISRKLASMTTSSPAPHDKRRIDSQPEKGVEIEYVRGNMHRLNPMALPPPALFFPPFSSSSSEVTDDEAMDTSDEDDSDDSVSAALISQRANPHHSVNTYPDDAELSSNDEEDEEDIDNNVSDSIVEGLGGKSLGRPADPRRVTSNSTRATAGKRGDALLSRSSVATAGGFESGYNSSMEDMKS